PGDILELCKIAEPTHGLITNIGKGHIEFFKSEDEVLKTKSALLNWVKDSGVGFINGDDERLKPFRGTGKKTISFGLSGNNDFCTSDIEMSQDACYRFLLDNKTDIKLKIPGKKNIYNAAAAAAVGNEFGLSNKLIKEGLESFKAYSLRGEIIEWNNINIINDSYNANPDSMLAALELLKEFPGKGSRIAVLGDMLELGSASRNEHWNIGLKLYEYNIKRLITVGIDSEHITNAASKSGKVISTHVNSHDAAAYILKKELQTGDIVLVKGSRGCKMEKVLDHLISSENN
ncbi:UDP-N-acetylmuramoyl-tripeptide--D-alanyl-D-alanine ligase, partial [candidate division KSB1 bacterium]